MLAALWARKTSRRISQKKLPPQVLSNLLWAAWFHNCNKAGLAAALKLRPEQRVLYAQTVGYSTR